MAYPDTNQLAFPAVRFHFLFTSRAAVMKIVLSIVLHTMVTHLTHKACFSKPMVRTDAATRIQRFGGVVNLNALILTSA